MFVEDLISDFATTLNKKNSPIGEYLRADGWATNFVQSVYTASVSQSKPLSSEQSRVFLNVVRRANQAGVLTASGYHEIAIANLLKLPQHRKEPYLSHKVPKEVRYLGDNKLGFRCKKIDEVILDIKALANRGRESSWQEDHRPYFNRQARIWIVPVTDDTYQHIIALIGNHDFKFDDGVLDYLALSDASRGEASTFVYDPETDQIVANICANPVLASWVSKVLFGEIL